MTAGGLILLNVLLVGGCALVAYLMSGGGKGKKNKDLKHNH
jgi:hypothetical protein